MLSLGDTLSFLLFVVVAPLSCHCHAIFFWVSCWPEHLCWLTATICLVNKLMGTSQLTRMHTRFQPQVSMVSSYQVIYETLIISILSMCIDSVCLCTWHILIWTERSFLPCDDMLAWYMLWRCVHLSVIKGCSIKMAKLIVILTMPLGSPGTSYFAPGMGA